MTAAISGADILPSKGQENPSGSPRKGQPQCQRKREGPAGPASLDGDAVAVEAICATENIDSVHKNGLLLYLQMATLI